MAALTVAVMSGKRANARVRLAVVIGRRRRLSEASKTVLPPCRFGSGLSPTLLREKPLPIALLCLGQAQLYPRTAQFGL